jgi:hypothetical protein
VGCGVGGCGTCDDACGGGLGGNGGSVFPYLLLVGGRESWVGSKRGLVR